MKLVTATGEVLGLIQSHVVNINEHVHSIATATKERSTGLGEVSIAVNQMDQVTQQNAAMVEESTAATSRLADEAANLARLIARFRIEGGAALRMAVPDSKLVVSPAQTLTHKLAGALGGCGCSSGRPGRMGGVLMKALASGRFGKRQRQRRCLMRRRTSLEPSTVSLGRISQ